MMCEDANNPETIYDLRNRAAAKVCEAARQAIATLRKTGRPSQVYLGDLERRLQEYDALGEPQP